MNLRLRWWPLASLTLLCIHPGLEGAQGATDRLVYTAADLTRYVQKWRVRDGEAARVISDYFCEFAVNNPEDFLRLMTKLGIFDEWLKQVADLSFVDYGGGCLDRECLRKQMLDSLGTLSGDERSPKHRLKRRLEEIRVRQID